MISVAFHSRTRVVPVGSVTTVSRFGAGVPVSVTGVLNGVRAVRESRVLSASGLTARPCQAVCIRTTPRGAGFVADTASAHTVDGGARHPPEWPCHRPGYFDTESAVWQAQYRRAGSSAF